MHKGYKILVASALTTTLIAPVASANTSFKDVQVGSSHYEAIQSLTERGIIKGYTSDQTFRPNNEVTRGQAAKMIAGALGYNTTNVVNPDFKDVQETHQYYGAIAALANHGIISGYANTKSFNPDEPMTRQQMAKVIALAFGLEASAGKTPFTDVAASYDKYVAALYENGITTGTSATTFAGNANVKRGQLASFIYRAENIQKNVSETKELTIESVASTVKTAFSELKVEESLKGLFNEANNEALKGAEVSVTVQAGVITEVKSLKLKNSGTEQQPLLFDGAGAQVNGDFIVDADYVKVVNTYVKGDLQLTNNATTEFTVEEVSVNGKFVVGTTDTKVASLTPIMASISNGPKITIVKSLLNNVIANRDHVQLHADTNISALTIAANVTNVQINANVDMLSIQSTKTLEIIGTSIIKTIKIEKSVQLALNIDGKVNEIQVKNSNAQIEISKTIKVEQVILPDNTEVTKIIKNFTIIKGNIHIIKSVVGTIINGPNNSTNNGAASDGTSSGGSSSGGSSTDIEISEQVKLVKFIENSKVPGRETIELIFTKPGFVIASDAKLVIKHGQSELASIPLSQSTLYHSKLVIPITSYPEVIQAFANFSAVDLEQLSISLVGVTANGKKVGNASNFVIVSNSVQQNPETPVEKFLKYYDELLGKSVNDIKLVDESDIEGAFSVLASFTVIELNEVTAQKKLLLAFLEKVRNLKLANAEANFTMYFDTSSFGSMPAKRVNLVFNEVQPNLQFIDIIRGDYFSKMWLTVTTGDTVTYSFASGEGNLPQFTYYVNLGTASYKFTLKDVSGVLAINKIEKLSTVEYVKSNVQYLLDRDKPFGVTAITEDNKKAVIENFLSVLELNVLQGYSYSVDVNLDGLVEITISTNLDTQTIVVDDSYFKDVVGPEVVTMLTTADTVYFTFTESLHVKDGEQYILLDTNTVSDLIKLVDSNGNVYPLTNVGVSLSEDRKALTLDFSENIIFGEYTITFNEDAIFDEFGNALGNLDLLVNFE